MGLDITAYRQISRIEAKDGDEAYFMGGFIAGKNSDFPGRADDVEDGAAYKAAEEFGFRAGSYGSYNAWREQLAKLAGYRPSSLAPTPRHHYTTGAREVDSGMFRELIDFSDCEGIIGAAVSAKLAKDFTEFQPKADAVIGHDAEWFKARYADWRKAFEMAADGGCVDFH